MLYSDIEMKLLKTGSTVQFEIPKFNVITLDIETYLEEVKDKKKIEILSLKKFCLFVSMMEKKHIYIIGKIIKHRQQC